jgi:hypothetical protein
MDIKLRDDNYDSHNFQIKHTVLLVPGVKKWCQLRRATEILASKVVSLGVFTQDNELLWGLCYLTRPFWRAIG